MTTRPADPTPDTDVQPAEYQRLLGYPPEHELTDRARQLCDGARRWYGRHGRPWVRTTMVGTIGLNDGAVTIGGERFGSARLFETLEAAGAHAAHLVAVSAGPEVEAEARRLAGLQMEFVAGVSHVSLLRRRPKESF